MTKNIHTCPKCHTNGNVVQHKEKRVMIDCPRCFKSWFADSKICPSCEKPNGFAVEGLCSHCYSDSRR